MAVVRRFLQDPGGSYFLFGPRGTGKSTWLRKAYPDALWVDLLAPEVHRHYTARPERLKEVVAGNPGRKVVVIDEIQKAPILLDVVHEIVETRRGAPRFVLTGSSARKLKRTVSLAHPTDTDCDGDAVVGKSAADHGLGFPVSCAASMPTASSSGRGPGPSTRSITSVRTRLFVAPAPGFPVIE